MTQTVSPKQITIEHTSWMRNGRYHGALTVVTYEGRRFEFLGRMTSKREAALNVQYQLERDAR